MKAEIVAVGTELLMGQIVNTNAQYLAQQCAAAGVHVYYQSVVGDNPARIAETLRLAAGRSDLIICTGGLGPTRDDLTRDVLASVTGRGLVHHAPSLAKIEAYYRDRQLAMPESNARQALYVEGADALPNDAGMAVGTALTHEGKHYVLLPGPPIELKPMFERRALPWIRSRMADAVPLYSKILRFAGIGESSLEKELIDLIDGQSDPTLAPYAKEGEVTIRVTTAARTPEEGEAKIAPTLAEIRRRLGPHLYAESDIPLEEAVVRLLLERGLKLATAESCTGGMLGERLTSVPGCSGMYAGGWIVYANAGKEEWLGVPHEVLEGEDAPGAVSEETARLLALSALSRSRADLAVSVTGVAGPAHSERKPVGLVYVGIASRGGALQVWKLQHAGSREMIRIRTVKSALYQLWKLVQGL